MLEIVSAADALILRARTAINTVLDANFEALKDVSWTVSITTLEIPCGATDEHATTTESPAA